MRIVEREIAILLGEDGGKVAKLAGIPLSGGSQFLWLHAYVEESDDLGLWARLDRPDGDHLFLIRWEYVLAIDVLEGQPQVLGLR